MYTVICHTLTCSNREVPIVMQLTYADPDTGEEVTVSGVICGACGNPITDVTPAPDESPVEPAEASS